jgi:hypothetical protein
MRKPARPEYHDYAAAGQGQRRLRTTVNTSASGTCIGSRVTGTGIYYTARSGERGTDTFSIQAELGGDVTQRSFTVEIVE